MGQSAIEAARRFQPQVIVCDIGLPHMNGYEVAKQYFRALAGHRAAHADRTQRLRPGRGSAARQRHQLGPSPGEAGRAARAVCVARFASRFSCRPRGDRYMQLIIRPDDGVAPMVEAIERAKKTIDIVIFRFESRRLTMR